MFAHFRRHKWLWFLVFGGTILSFVWFFAPQQGGGGYYANANTQVGSINGRPVTRNEYANAYQEASLRFLFSYGEWPQESQFARQGGVIENETRNRLLLNEKVKEFDIKVSDKAAADWIAEAFRDPETGVFRKRTYDQFMEVLPRRGLSRRDFERFVHNEVAIQHLVAVTGLSGKLVTPQEAELRYRRENEQVDAEVVFVPSTNFLAKVNLDPVAIATYYTNNAALYRLPEKVQVSYVAFSASNYLAQAAATLSENPNLNQIIDAAYAQRGTNYLDSSNQPLPPDAAKAKIKEEFLEQVAVGEAQQEAVKFANVLFENEHLDMNSLDKAAEAKGLKVEVTEPFTQYGMPPNLQVPPTFTQVAFSLTPEQPVAEQPIVGEKAVYIIALKGRLPSELPPLDNIRERVTEDYRRSQSGELASKAGEELYAKLTNAVAQGKSFQEAAREAGANYLDLPPISQKTPSVPELPSRDFSTVKDQAFSLGVGKISSYSPTPSGGVIVYLKAKVPVDQAKMQAEIPEYLKDLRQSHQYDAFREWFTKQMEMAKISLPGDREQTATAAN